MSAVRYGMNLSARELETLVAVALDPARLGIFERLVKSDHMAARLWLFLESEHITGEPKAYPVFRDEA